MANEIAKSVIGGRNSSVIGSKDTPLILRGLGIKIQWGNKFIDLVKNGKIATQESESILKVVDSSDNITANGLYIIKDSEEVWVYIDGTKVNITGDTCVSFLTAQEDITVELKYQALTNIGFYYETLDEAKAENIKAGIIYVNGDNKLYVANEGNLTEYIITNPLNLTTNKETEESVPEIITFSDNSLLVNEEEYAEFIDNNIIFKKKVIFNNILLSSNGKFNVYIKDGLSILEVDKVILTYKEVTTSQVYSLQVINVNDTTINDNIITCRTDNHFLDTNHKICVVATPTVNIIEITNDFLDELRTTPEPTISVIGGKVQVKYATTGKHIHTLTGVGMIDDKEESLEKVFSSENGEFTLNDEFVSKYSSINITLQSVKEGEWNQSVVNCVITKNPETDTFEDGVYYEGLENVLWDYLEELEGNTNRIAIYLSFKLQNAINMSISTSRKTETETETETEIFTFPANTHLQIIDVYFKSFNYTVSYPELSECYFYQVVGVNNKDFDIEVENLEQKRIFKKNCSTVYTCPCLVILNGKLTVVGNNSDSDSYLIYDNVKIPDNVSDEVYNKVIPNVEWVKKLYSGVPSGAIVMWKKDTTIPDGWSVWEDEETTYESLIFIIKQ